MLTKFPNVTLKLGRVSFAFRTVTAEPGRGRYTPIMTGSLKDRESSGSTSQLNYKSFEEVTIRRKHGGKEVRKGSPEGGG
jgi:hypothetical protein